MSEQRRFTDRIKWWAGIITAIIVIVSTLSTVYSWYFIGKDTCVKVGRIESRIENHEQRITEEEKKSSVQYEINKKLDSMEKKIDILIMRR